MSAPCESSCWLSLLRRERLAPPCCEDKLHSQTTTSSPRVTSMALKARDPDEPWPAHVQKQLSDYRVIRSRRDEMDVSNVSVCHEKWHKHGFAHEHPDLDVIESDVILDYTSHFGRTSIIRTCFSGPSFSWILISHILRTAANLFTSEYYVMKLRCELNLLRVKKQIWPRFVLIITNAFHWALIGSEISGISSSISVVWRTWASFCVNTNLSVCTKSERSILPMKDKQSAIILRLEKGTNLSTEYGVNKQHISDIRKHKDEIIRLPQDL